MPEKAANHSAFQICYSCATPNRSRLGPLPTVSHAEVCCLFKVTAPERQSSPDSFLNEGCAKHNHNGCKGKPSTLETLPVCPVSQPRQGRGSDSSQEGCKAALAVTSSPSKKRKSRIEPRLRVGFKKFTLEWRPPYFRKKLWFGTYTKDETDLATDAVNFYTSCGQPYKYPDSWKKFAQKPLKGIKFEDLQPSCSQYIQVGDNRELAHRYFARQVKEAIHSVMGKQYKSAQRRPKCKVSHNLQPSLTLEEPLPVLDICDPIMSTPASQRVRPETDSHSMFLPQDEVDTELLRCLSHNRHHEGEFTLDEVFNYLPAISPSDSSESNSTIDIDCYLVEDDGYRVQSNGYDSYEPMEPLRFYQQDGDQGFLHEWNQLGISDK